MRKKILYLILISLIISFSALLYAEGTQENENVRYEFEDVPDWIKRTNLGAAFETDIKPRAYLETVKPLFLWPDETKLVFTHDRLSIHEERGTYSAGLGFRNLMFNERLLAGANAFFDYQDLHRHYRTGWGFEAITDKLEARLNTYNGLSHRRTIEETSTTYIYEKAVDGFDAEVGTPIPYFPWLKVFGSYYLYDFENFEDMKGWKARGEIKPFKAIAFNLEAYDDNKGEREYRVDGRFCLAFDDFRLRDILKPAKVPYPKVELKKRMLDRVERNFNIQVEKWSEAKTGGFRTYIGRGT